ncbi:MAG: mechanosensitive ion channel family protein [Pirellula sp.]|jgi:small conductance mechanosensitive channel|nr:mechanosensitive ion channel family protein [Pirellula sp.]
MDAILKNLGDIKTAVTTGDWNTLWQMGGQSLIKAIEALLLMLVFYFVAKYLSRAIANPLSKRVDQTLGKFVEKLVYRGLLGFGLLIVLAYFGVQSASFAALIAAMGFAIGLAFQGTLSNFAAGILMLVFRPFKVGDLVVAGGVTARVQEIDLFHTIVDTLDNRRLIIPNNSISSNTIENVTFHPHRRIEVPLSISHDANLDATRTVLTRALDAVPEVRHTEEHLQPQVLIVGLTNISIEWVVRGWAPTADFALVRDKLIYQIKTHLNQSEIAIAAPQMEVKLKENTGAKSLSGRTLSIDSDLMPHNSHEESSAFTRNRLTPRRAEAS